MNIDDWKTPEEQDPQRMRRLFPPRRVPSYEDDLYTMLRAQSARSTYIGNAGTHVDLLDLVRTRIDAPFFIGLQGRAAICLRLSGRMVPDLDAPALGFDDPDPTFLIAAYLHGGYPLLRTVLLLPVDSAYPLEFEAPLVLSQGDVQEFCIAMLKSRKVELHIGHVTDNRSLSVEFSVPGADNVLSRAIRDITANVYPADESGVVAAINRMSVDFPEITGGFTERDAVRLKGAEPVSSIVYVEISFRA